MLDSRGVVVVIAVFIPADKHGNAALDNVEFGLLFLGQVLALAAEEAAPLCDMLLIIVIAADEEEEVEGLFGSSLDSFHFPSV
nr:hypothetical protein Saspl_014391 [Ipomoea batatas]GME08054.1 hypothetical protein Saspl_014391 [Ipomoea batatas]GME11440.1 hypothetical protein Saspl_014391 [Ipomoea batatas]